MSPIALTRLRRGWGFLVAALLCGAVLSSPAQGAATPTSASHFYITGGGFGHGIGMSQYGAAGFAEHGYSYRQILAHYYSTTTIGKVNPNHSVTVLLHEGAATFSGATKVKGWAKHLNPLTNYGVLVVGTQIRLISRGRTIGTFAAPLTVSGPGPLRLVGIGRYRGAFVFRPAPHGGVMTINSVGLDDYVRGVVAAEMPSSWPLQALEAQAVAARTYALTAGAVASAFDLYDDTRSQMYEGLKAETPITNRAVAATTGQVVEYDGQPVVTYFFASSGGYTESIQNVWYGVEPEAWLVGVRDPYDDSYNNPYYRWLDAYTVPGAQRKLKRYYKGAFEGVDVTQTGVSPRVVQAQVVGTDGDSTVSGAQLQSAFGTLSTYMQFTTITENGEHSSTPVSASTAPVTAPPNTITTTTPPPTQTTPAVSTTTPTTTAPATTTTTTPTGGAPLAVRAHISLTTTPSDFSIQGTLYPVAEGQPVIAQSDQSGAWTSVAEAQVTATGSYTIPVPGAGVYRVEYGGIDGPDITVP
ncbi:MAG TPA: SpoIID/LytB domain-containing protein [Solirubrobacteraceae bacterium]|nr:SpoIID/LytB domain-containing protein [Solirubrobacteraceae bacterium]